MNKVIKNIYIVTTYVISKIIPKKKKLWLFCPIHYKGRMDGNIEHFYKYVVSNSPDIEVLIRDVRLYGTANSTKVRLLSFNLLKLLKDIIWISRAEVVITDAQFYLQHLDIKLIQLWHGTGFKNIQSMNRHQNRFKGYSDRIELIVATSKVDQERKVDSFRTNKVFVTGSPRNDVFFQSDAIKERDKISTELDLNRSSKWILYAPTFRDHHQKQPFSHEEWRIISDVCNELGFLFLVKKHPSDKQLEVPNDVPNIVDVTATKFGTQELLLVSDVLISDYSGIVTDFSLLGRPMIFFTYDYEDYIAGSRDFYYDLKNTLPGPFVKSCSELVDVLSKLESYINEYTPRWNDFCNRFHTFKDGKSSERVYLLVRKL